MYMLCNIANRQTNDKGDIMIPSNLVGRGNNSQKNILAVSCVLFFDIFNFQFSQLIVLNRIHSEVANIHQQYEIPFNICLNNKQYLSLKVSLSLTSYLSFLWYQWLFWEFLALFYVKVIRCKKGAINYEITSVRPLYTNSF